MLTLQLVTSVVVICHTVSGAKQVGSTGEAVEASFIKRAIHDFEDHGAR